MTFGLSDPDLFFGFQGSHFTGSLKVTAQRTSTCAVLNDAIVKGTLIDLYDFEYGQSGPARWASIVQAGYPTLGSSGNIFRNEVQLNGPVTSLFFNFATVTGSAALCSQVKVP